ncbi:uncharacterized protein EMH_0016290 [Eimeria mitis]|uniref:Dynactin subunit 2 n=1 Tax=Eimeria mitis TaxID=44415 RepID=U6KEP3_9EIME|nr:uncharacterized protein EMH_0016290 [Eimeria mitis]CDJ36394.1 hypothetical protein, conserved [Eimeria mitis]
MNESTSFDPSKGAELLMGANGAGGKEVYEYTPDPGSVLIHDSSSQDGFDRDAYRLTRGAKEIDDSEVSPSTAYEFFRGKTYKSTAFRNGFVSRQGWGPSDSGPLEVRGQRTQHAALKGSRAGKEGSMDSAVSDFPESTFETPIGRLKRLQGEVEEMLDFVSSFLVEERVPASDRSEVQSVSQPAEAAFGEPREESSDAKHLGTHHVHYHTRRLPPAAQEALLFGHDPLSLIEELKKLRMQVASVLSDTRTEALVSHIEPVTGMKSGTALLQQHLAAASAQLQRTLGREGKGAPPPPSSASPRNASAPALATSDMPNEAGPSKRDGGGNTGPTTAYEVYCVPSLSPMMEQSRITSLERRLAFVENKIGLQKMSLLPHADLFEAALLLELHALQQRRHELDMAAEGLTVSSGATGMEPGKGLASGSASSSDWQRVEDLYDICERWKAPAALLPSVLQRLKLLKGIHQEAGGVAVRLSVLEKQQEELQAWVKRADDAVTQLQKTVLDSVEWAQKTVAQMQQRLAAVAPSTATDA